jgi:carbon storage regulator
MLYLTRRQGEAVIIDNEITVRVVELRGRSVKLGFTFPAGVSVLREELFVQVRAANEAASRSAAALEAWNGTERASDPGEEPR